MKHLVCAAHRAAHAYAQQQSWSQSDYRTHTTAQALRTLSRDSEIIVIDTPYKMQDSREIQALINTRFTNVRHDSLRPTGLLAR